MTSRRISITTVGAVLALVSAGGMVFAQPQPQPTAESSPKAAGKSSGGGAAERALPVAGASGSFEVSGVMVDVSGKTADAARQGGWRLAQRKGWAMLSQRMTGKQGSLSDSALDSLVTGIVVENEQIGPTRYIARLGVLFDRSRAGALLGVSTAIHRSPPMLVIPLEWSGGAGIGFERATPWQRAWARFRSGESSIDYVRPAGTGPDTLLLTAGQTGRRGRGWWRTILDQYGASDVLIPEVQLRREWPGGPITGIFTASHGPDRRRITRFALRVENADALDTLLDDGVKRIDQAYRDALSAGMLRTDRLLGIRPPSAKPETEETPEGEASPTPTTTPTEGGTIISVQVDTPSASAVANSESAMRGIPGVRSAATTSLALGGVSVVRVAFDGNIASLRAALEARGWQVQEGAGVLRIRRPGAATPAAPAAPAGNTAPGG